MVSRLLAAALWVAFTLLVLPAGAQAAFPGVNGRIAFSSDRDGDFEIYSMNADGSAVTQLTSSIGSDLQPRWSQNGARIVFSSNRDGDFEIYVMKADGSGLQQLTSNEVDLDPVDDRYPAWSPDGTRITYATNRNTPPPYPYHLRVMNSDGTNDTELLPDYCDHVTYSAWSPDGQNIAYLYQSTNDEDVCFDETTPQIRLTGPSAGGVMPAREDKIDWAPDGGKIAFSNWTTFTRDVFTWNDPTGFFTVTNLTNTPSEDEAGTGWSPDNAKIAFTVSDGDREIFSMDADGSGRTRLTDNTAADTDPDWQPLHALNPFPRPGGATPLRVPLVPSYQQCTTPNSQHVEPLDEPSCTPPALSSQVLTTSSIGKGQGSARLDVMLGNSATPADEADVRIIARAYDVRCAATSSACPGGAGSDFTGRLLLSSSIRLTDRNSGFGGVSATVSDAKLQAPLDCSPTADTTLGSSCAATTTADSLIPGFVTEEKRSVISTFSLTLDDPGPNGSGYGSSCPPSCGDGDESPYLTQGVFTGL